jgi:micrococcal nuclease
MAPSKATQRRYPKKPHKRLTMHRKLISSLFGVAISALVGTLGITSLASSGEQPSFQAKVIHVDDGDTVVALTENGEKVTVRLASIDAPETFKNRCKPGQPFAQKAKDALSSMVHGKTVLFACHDRDIYGRQVCDIQQEYSTVSRELVSAGFAWANTSNKRYLRDKTLPSLEDQARLTRRGMWSTSDNVPPWEWRSTVWRNTCQASKGAAQ